MSSNNYGYSYRYGSYGKGSPYSGSSSSCLSIDLCPDLIMALTAAAGAAGVYFLYTAITVKAGRKFPSVHFGDIWDFVLYDRIE